MTFDQNLPPENTDPWYTGLVDAWDALKLFVNNLATQTRTAQETAEGAATTAADAAEAATDAQTAAASAASAASDAASDASDAASTASAAAETATDAAAAVSGKLDRVNDHTAAPLSVPDLRTTLRAALATTDSNLAEYRVGAALKFWQNEWGAIRGVSPYVWGDALVRAVREQGDGITSGRAFELQDRRTGAGDRIMFGVNWADGGLTQGGASVGTVFTLTSSQTTADIPATLPAGALIVKRTT